MQYIELSIDEWETTYKPIYNHLNTNASFQDDSGKGLMFETHGEEIDFVKDANPLCVWTLKEGDDGGTYISNGYYHVSRQGFFVTENPAQSNEECEILIKVSSSLFYCENCESQIEDDGMLISEVFSEYECCPRCLTSEQLEKIEEDSKNWAQPQLFETIKEIVEMQLGN